MALKWTAYLKRPRMCQSCSICSNHSFSKVQPQERAAEKKLRLIKASACWKSTFSSGGKGYGKWKGFIQFTEFQLVNGGIDSGREKTCLVENSMQQMSGSSPSGLVEMEMPSYSTSESLNASFSNSSRCIESRVSNRWPISHRCRPQRRKNESAMLQWRHRVTCVQFL